MVIHKPDLKKRKGVRQSQRKRRGKDKKIKRQRVILGETNKKERERRKEARRERGRVMERGK